MKTLDELLQENKFILMDGCVPSISNRNLVFKYQSEILDSDFERFKTELNIRERIFANYNIHTIPKVLTETDRFLQYIVRYRILNNEANNEKKKDSNYNGFNLRNRDKLKEIYNNCLKILKNIKLRLYFINDPFYDVLSNIVSSVVYEEGIKNFSEEKDYVGTDEKLLAAGYYRSISKRNSCVVSADSHIMHTHRAMLSLANQDPMLYSIVSNTDVYFSTKDKFLKVTRGDPISSNLSEVIAYLFEESY